MGPTSTYTGNDLIDARVLATLACVLPTTFGCAGEVAPNESAAR